MSFFFQRYSTITTHIEKARQAEAAWSRFSVGEMNAERQERWRTHGILTLSLALSSNNERSMPDSKRLECQHSFSPNLIARSKQSGRSS